MTLIDQLIEAAHHPLGWTLKHEQACHTNGAQVRLAVNTLAIAPILVFSVYRTDVPCAIIIDTLCPSNVDPKGLSQDQIDQTVLACWSRTLWMSFCPEGIQFYHDFMAYMQGCIVRHCPDQVTEVLIGYGQKGLNAIDIERHQVLWTDTSLVAEVFGQTYRLRVSTNKMRLFEDKAFGCLVLPMPRSYHARMALLQSPPDPPALPCWMRNLSASL